jgi:hypothetical protein
MAYLDLLAAEQNGDASQQALLTVLSTAPETNKTENILINFVPKNPCKKISYLRIHMPAH